MFRYFKYTQQCLSFRKLPGIRESSYQKFKFKQTFEETKIPGP
jgi:hypothetical protein